MMVLVVHCACVCALHCTQVLKDCVCGAWISIKHASTCLNILAVHGRRCVSVSSRPAHGAHALAPVVGSYWMSATLSGATITAAPARLFLGSICGGSPALLSPKTLPFNSTSLLRPQLHTYARYTAAVGKPERNFQRLLVNTAAAGAGR